MTHTQLNHLIAEQRTADRHRAAEHERINRSIRADRRAGAPIGRIARLATALHVRRGLPEVRPSTVAASRP